MKKFDSSIEYPPLFNLVLVYYKQGKGEGWATCYSVGFWNGEKWKRPSFDKAENCTNYIISNVEGWEEIELSK